MLGIHTDISSYKSADARTMDALAFGQAVFNSSPEAVIAYGPDGRAVIANKAAARIIGTDLPGLLEQNFRELDSWRESGLLAAAEEALASGREVRRTGPVTTTFGHTRQLATIMVPFDHQSGRHLLLVISDVTENLRVIERLQVMHAAILAVPIGWVVTDPTGVIEWVNPAFTTLTGYAAEEVIGKNPRVLKSGRHSAEFYKAMWSTIARGEVWSGEIFNQRKDGGLYHEYMTIAPVCDEHGDIMHFVAMKQDLSERKNLEQQLARAQRLESIGLLASGIAHDLNNIFAPIQLSLELLKLKYPAADGKKMVELIEASVHRGAGIVRQVLTFARGIESQRMILNPKYLVKELAQILDETFTRQIKIVTRVENDLKSIEADSTQLHQVLLNLAINARDAMPNGGTLLLSATNVEVDSARAMLNPPLKPGPHVALIVEDTGSGISPEVLEHMFEPFYTTKPRGQGTGLGLSTVYGIVRNHGGALEVSSQLGVGTKFTVLLPAKDEAPAKPDSNAPMPAVVQGNGRRILVVDDEESIRLVTLHVLKRNGFVPLVAIDGVEALEIFRSDPTTFAGMITDLMMPRMNGQQLIMEVRRLAPMLPIIASSGLFEGKIDESPETTLQSLGVKTMLRKPYTEEELLEALRTELEPKEAKTS
jgi:PAS domain S-box-containing protein